MYTKIKMNSSDKGKMKSVRVTVCGHHLEYILECTSLSSLWNELILAGNVNLLLNNKIKH